MSLNNTALPAIRIGTSKEPSNWHGANARFSKHYASRFYQDNSLAKAARTANMSERYKEREVFYDEEIKKIEKNRFVLLNIGREKERFESIKKRVLTEKKILERRIKKAAICIQKNVRGYLARLHHEYEMAELKKVKLVISLRLMKRNVGECCVYLADNIVPATIVIQKYMRKYLAIKLLKKLKKEDKASRAITRFFRVIRNRSKFRRNLNILVTHKKLKEIKRRLKMLRVKYWWKKHRERFAVIRKKIAMIKKRSSRLDVSPSRHRINSIDSKRSSRRGSMSIQIKDTESITKIHNLFLNTDLPHAVLLNPDGILEKNEEESPTNVMKIVNVLRHTPDRSSRVSNADAEDLDFLSANELGDQSKSQLDSSENSLSKGEQEDFSSNENESFSDNEEAEELEIEPEKADDDEEAEENLEEPEALQSKPKPQEIPEKPIPSHRRPTVASTQMRKKPETPPEPPKEIYPPPKHLLVWTKCRKIYKNQTKKYKKFVPLWKPPLSANETKIRKLPKLVVRKHKIPEFLEPYDPPGSSDSSDSGLLVNKNEDSDTYSVDSDTSYEYEPADYQSTGLKVALPQLYSIVKSYGKNADIVASSSKKNKSIS